MRAGLVLVVVLACMATATATAGHDVRGAPAPTARPTTVAQQTASPLPVHATDTIPTTSTRIGGISTQIDGEPDPVPGGDPVDAPRTNLTVRLQPNGDAVWTATVAVSLDGPNETRAFRDLAERYEAGRADVGPSPAPFERAVAAASEGVEREMTLLDVSRSARVENGTGYLTLRFLWTNFATESGGRLRVGDAFRTPRGTWLPGLAANQTLLLVPPPGYGVNSAPIGPENGTLRWEGPQTFEPGYLSVTYRRGLRDDPTTATTTAATTAAEPDSEGAIVPIAGIAMLGVGLLVVLYARSRGIVLPGGRKGEGESGNDGTATGTGVEHETGADGSASGAATGGGGGSDGGATADIDEALLSDEERVERLLRENGGRMRQASIVTETQWSNAKVSQLLSAMDREGRIDKLRIGRENLISLPDEDVSDVDEK